jgi:hypothetical protein
MANYKNAFITKQPNTVNPSNWINQQEQTNLYYKQLADQKNEREEKKQKEDSQAYRDDYLELNFADTGNDFFNQVGAGVARMAVKKADDLYRKMSEVPYGSKEYNELWMAYQKANKADEDFAKAFQSSANKLNQLATDVKNENIFLTPDNLKKLEAFQSGAIRVFNNDKGKFFVEIGADLDGDGENDLYSFDDLQNGALDFGAYIPNVNRDEYLKTAVGNLGTKEYQQLKGYNIDTVKNSWDDIMVNGKKMPGIKTLLQEQFSELPEDVVASFAWQFDQLEYLKLNDQEKLKYKIKLQEELTENSRQYLPESVKRAFDNARRTQDIRNKPNPPQIKGLQYVDQKTIWSADKKQEVPSGVHQFAFNDPYVINEKNDPALSRTINGFEIRDEEITLTGEYVEKQTEGNDDETKVTRDIKKEYRLSSDNQNNKIEILNTINRATGLNFKSYDDIVKKINSGLQPKEEEISTDEKAISNDDIDSLISEVLK